MLAASMTGMAALGLSGAVTAPAEASSSWKLKRTVHFTGSSLPEGCGAYIGPYTGGKSYWARDDVAVSGGLLRLTLRQRTVKDHQWTSGGVGCWGWAQKYGRYEIRAKVPPGKGIDSYLTLWPSKGGETGWTGIELLAPGPDAACVTNGYGAGSDRVTAHGRYSDDFHVYAIEWSPKRTRITVDGEEIFTSPRSYQGARWLGMVMSNGDALTGVPDESTALPAQFHIDYVKVYSFTGKEPGPARTAATPTPAPTATPEPTPTPSVSPSPTASDAGPLDRVSAESSGSDLAGGVWPWLLGGSLIAGLAAALLGRPRRHHQD